MSDSEVTLDKEQIKALQSYRRLWISVRDLEECNEMIQQIVNLGLKHPGMNQANPLLAGITSALVVAYSRPFVKSRGNNRFADRMLPGSLLRVFSRNERSLHEYIISKRNTAVAHSDSDILELSLKLYPDGDSGIHRVVNEPLYRSDLYILQKMVSKLLDIIDSECVVLRKNLPLYESL